MKSDKNSFLFWLRAASFALFGFDILLGLAHMLWPEYSWGQGRESYFDLNNSLTLAAWLVSMQLGLAALLAVVCYLLERRLVRPKPPSFAGIWIPISVSLFIISFFEITRLPIRAQWFGLPNLLPFHGAALWALCQLVLVPSAVFIVWKFRSFGHYLFIKLWLIAWNIYLALSFLFPFGSGNQLWLGMIRGEALLLGSSGLLLGLIGYLHFIFNNGQVVTLSLSANKSSSITVPIRTYIALACTAFLFMFLELLLYRDLSICADYLEANSVIGLALLGGVLGGLLGYIGQKRHLAGFRLIFAIITIPAIFLAGSSVVFFSDYDWIIIPALTLPFILLNATLVLGLIELNSARAYGATLVGAALAPLTFGLVLAQFREESAVIFLTALAAIAVLGYYQVTSETRHWRLKAVFASIAVLLLLFSITSRQNDQYNILHFLLRPDYPDVQFISSGSNAISRYDVVKRHASSTTCKTYENGRTIDTMRDWPVDHYQIDPRIPNSLFEDPRILVIGLSGDGISKSSRAISTRVTGLEINPFIARQQWHDLAPYNGNSYQDIDVQMLDGRTFLERSSEQFDMITLLNTHFARGSTSNRSVSPEYLFTREAFNTYIEHLSDSGLIIIEEPVGSPDRARAVWKMLHTARTVLAENGSADPAGHIYAFQWKTSKNNYYQILIRKTPWTASDLEKLDHWLYEVENIVSLEEIAHKQLGPITSYLTTLHDPRQMLPSTLSRVARGELTDEYLTQHNINVLTDNQPFLFDLDPSHPRLRHNFKKFLLMAIPLLFLIVFPLRRQRVLAANHIQPFLIVILTGLGFLLVEIVLLLRLGILTGAPTISFAAVLGSLLIASGLGSMYSNRLSLNRVAHWSLFIPLLLCIQLFVLAVFESSLLQLSLPARIVASILLITPFGFFAGITFPAALQLVKDKLGDEFVPALYSINGLASALAVPLGFYLVAEVGYRGLFVIGMVMYVLVALLFRSLSSSKNSMLLIGTAIFLSVVLGAPWLLNSRNSSAEQVNQTRVFALSYGSSLFWENKAIHGGENERINFEWMFWLIHIDDKIILVDTGSDDPGLARRWKIKDHYDPVQRLKQMGIKPNMVTDIIISHAHWDHMGCIGRYPKATFWIQKREYEHSLANHYDQAKMVHGMNSDDITQLIQIDRSGRLVAVEGDTTLVHGVELHKAGGHTPGSQFVTVTTADGVIVLASDEANLYRNIHMSVPGGNAYRKNLNRHVLRTMSAMAASPYLIIPGHEPRVFRYFPEVSPEIVEITMRPSYEK